MAELLAVGAAIGTVVQLGDYAFRFSTRLLSYTNSVHRADKTLASVANEISSTKTVLSGLMHVLDEGTKDSWSSDSDDASPKEKRVKSRERSFVSIQCVGEIKWAISEITSVFDEIREMMEASLGVSMKDVKPSSDNEDGEDVAELSQPLRLESTKISTSKRFKFPLKEPKLNLLRSQLSHLKGELMLKLQVLTTVRDFRLHKKSSYKLFIKKEECKRLLELNSLLRQDFEKLKTEYEIQQEAFAKRSIASRGLQVSESFDSMEHFQSRSQSTFQSLASVDSAFESTTSFSTDPTSIFSDPSPNLDDTAPSLMLGELILALNLTGSIINHVQQTSSYRQLPMEQMKAFTTLSEALLQARSFEQAHLLTLSSHLAWSLLELESKHVFKLRTLMQQLIKDSPRRNFTSPRNAAPVYPFSFYRPVAPVCPKYETSLSSSSSVFRLDSSTEEPMNGHVIDSDELPAKKIRIDLLPSTFSQTLPNRPPRLPRLKIPSSPSTALRPSIAPTGSLNSVPPMRVEPSQLDPQPEPASLTPLEAAAAVQSGGYIGPDLRRQSVSSVITRNLPNRSNKHSTDESEKDDLTICPIPECGKFVPDLETHMLTHQTERIERDPYGSSENNGMDSFPFSYYPVSGSQELNSQSWYVSSESNYTNLQARSPWAIYPQQNQHHQQQGQGHQQQHQGWQLSQSQQPNAPGSVFSVDIPSRTPIWQPPHQPKLSKAQRSLAPPTRPDISRHSSISSEGLSSGGSAGPSEYHHSEMPPKRKRGRPPLLRPAVEPKSPKISRRQPHNMVEHKYREGLNREMERLRSAIPNLEGALGTTVGNKASKATILQSAVEEIESLRKEKEKLEEIPLKGMESSATYQYGDLLNADEDNPDTTQSENPNWDQMARDLMHGWTNLDESEIEMIMPVETKKRKRTLRNDEDIEYDS